MKTYNYQIRQDGKHWRDIDPVAMSMPGFDQAADHAKDMAEQNGREVRLSEKGSLQGYYFRP